jgi:hypothetical protein
MTVRNTYMLHDSYITEHVLYSINDIEVLEIGLVYGAL